MTRSFLAVLLFLAAGTSRAECECLWQGSFAEVQSATDIVVSGTVIAAKGNSIDLRIEDTLRGSAVPEEVRIWLKTSDYCRPEVGLFPPDTSWVMALDLIREDVPGGFNPDTPNISYGRIGDYQLSSCGGYWLSLKSGSVTGNLVDAPRWVHDPKMTPVLLELVAAYIEGKVEAGALREASREDPALRELKMDTRAFLRGDEE